MADEFIPFGIPYLENTPDSLTHDRARRTFAACQNADDFEIVQLCYLEDSPHGPTDVIIVDCINPQVPSRNTVGIKVRERLALVFTNNPRLPMQVRALRKDFPLVLHLNQVKDGEPADICLYSEPWTAIERTWTPQKYLQRILWWLSAAATETLHHPGQVPEQMYLDSYLELVLPPDFDKNFDDASKSLDAYSVEYNDGKFRVIKSRFIPKAGHSQTPPPKRNDESITFQQVNGIFLPKQQENKKEITPIVVSIEPIIHSRIEKLPNTLGELNDQLIRRGTQFLQLLEEAIKARISGAVEQNPKGYSLIIICIPIKRSDGGDIERYDKYGFVVNADITAIGADMGILYAEGKQFYPVTLLSPTSDGSLAKWRTYELIPIKIKFSVTKEFANSASGITDDNNSIKAILAGVGALGSTLADLWSKSAWGDWTLVDPDLLEVHNTVRHLARERYVGSLKVFAVKNMMELNYSENYSIVQAIPELLPIYWTGIGV